MIALRDKMSKIKSTKIPLQLITTSQQSTETIDPNKFQPISPIFDAQNKEAGRRKSSKNMPML